MKKSRGVLRNESSQSGAHTERESVNELVSLVERLSSPNSMTRYQHLAALIEVSAILGRMSTQNADEVFRELSTLSKDNFRTEAYKIVSKNNPTGMKSVA
jgi:hypothetical protein